VWRGKKKNSFGRGQDQLRLGRGWDGRWKNGHLKVCRNGRFQGFVLKGGQKAKTECGGEGDGDSGLPASEKGVETQGKSEGGRGIVVNRDRTEGRRSTCVDHSNLYKNEERALMWRGKEKRRGDGSGNRLLGQEGRSRRKGCWLR